LLISIKRHISAINLFDAAKNSTLLAIYNQNYAACTNGMEIKILAGKCGLVHVLIFLNEFGPQQNLVANVRIT
jgi:hypothetical protein